MKKILLSIFITITLTLSANAQTNIYANTSYEMLLSFSQLDAFNSNKGMVTRFAPWFNLQENVNFDVSQIFGFSIGASIQNIGFIYNLSNPSSVDPSFSSSAIKKKFRTYNLGIPIGFKLGNLDNFFLSAGYSLEFPINYKEKTFIENDKTKYSSEWFSNKTPYVSQAVFLGITFPHHFGVKVKYYISEFFDPNCEDLVHDLPTIKYNDLHCRVFYISLTYDFLENTHSYYVDHRKSAENLEFYY